MDAAHNQEMTPEQQAELAKTIRSKAVRLAQAKAMVDANKPLYEEIDKLTLELRALLPEGTASIPLMLEEKETAYLAAGDMKFMEAMQVVTIVDNFAEKNTVFRPAGVKRFEASVESATAYNARLEKEAKAREKKSGK